MQQLQTALTGSYNENPSWYQPSDLRQIEKLRDGYSIVDFDDAEECRVYVTTTQAMNFQDDIPSIPIDNFKDHWVLLFDLTLMQGAAENCHYLDLYEVPRSLELKTNFPLEHATELNVLRERMSSVAVDKYCVVRKNFFKWIVFSPAKINRIP